MNTDAIRLLHFADIHIGMENYGAIDPQTGVNQRVIDFVARLAEVIDAAIGREADLVIFAGDAFKTRDPNPTYQRAFARQMMRLSRAGIPTVLLVGNHDMPVMEKRASSLDIYRTLEVPGVIVGSKEELLRIETKRGSVQIATAPWPQRSRLLQDRDLRAQNVDDLDRELARLVEEEIKRLATLVDPSMPAVLTGHFSVAGAVFGSERNVMVGRDAVISKAALDDPAWDYVALGHIHKHQDINSGGYPAMVYPGSLERIDFGEENQPKGVCWVELRRGATTWEFQPVAVRDFVTISADATGDGDTPTEAVLRAIERRHIADAIVRVRVKLLQEQEPRLRLRDIERALAEARYIAGIARDIQRDVRARIGLEGAESLTPAQLLDLYLKSKNTPVERADEVAALARSVFVD